MKNIMLERIKALREDNDLSQNEVAEKLNIAQRTYSGYETGTRAFPISVLIELAKLYDVSLDWICGLK